MIEILIINERELTQSLRVGENVKSAIEPYGMYKFKCNKETILFIVNIIFNKLISNVGHWNHNVETTSVHKNCYSIFRIDPVYPCGLCIPIHFGEAI